MIHATKLKYINKNIQLFKEKISFAEELEYKERAFEILPMLKNLYQEPTNPNFKVFYIEIKQVKTFSYAEGPKEYKL